MKAYLKVSYFFVASIALLTIILSGCSATRYLEDDQVLVRSVRLEGIDNDFTEQAYYYVQQEIRPNSRLNLGLYNLFNTKDGKYRTDRKKRDIGEAPHLLDSTQVEISRNELEKFLKTKSFFNATVKSEVKIKNQKAYITFIATPRNSFVVGNFSYVIPDTAVKNLYVSNRKEFTKISSEMRYDEDSLKNESIGTYNTLRVNGYYDYVTPYMRFQLDTNSKFGKVDLKMFIDNPAYQSKHTVYNIFNTEVTIANSSRKAYHDVNTLSVDSQYVFRDSTGRFKFKSLLPYIFYKKYDLFDNDKRELTYNRLYELNVFKNITITYEKRKDDSTALDVKINVVPLKRMSNRVEGEYTFNSGRNGFNIGNTFTNRNVFGGAEQLDVKVRYGILFDKLQTSGIFNRDFQIGVNLTFPRLLTPFPVPAIVRYGLPRTILSSSLQIFDQSNAFSNRLFVNSLTYNWYETKFKAHSFTPINMEYRDGRLTKSVINTLDSLGLQSYVATNNRRYINLGSQYSFTLNNNKLNTYENFVYLRNFVDLGGNSLALAANLFNFRKDNEGQRLFLGLPYQQYAKTEMDLRIYRYLGKDRQFIFRIFPGFAYPYGNIKELPFEKRFFAGGSTGIRAWQARTLGPGNYNRTIFPENLRRAYTGLDQLGDIKLESNIEYRFKILDNLFGAKLKGATFVDWGNIWSLKNSIQSDTASIKSELVKNPEYDDVQLKANKFYKQIAIGTGAGLRFDLDYFVFRLDLGIKVKDPQFGDGNQWVIKHLFNSKEFRDNYKITNTPDRYSLFQINFGIGLPF